MKNKLDLAMEVANDFNSAKGIDCPRYILNPGIYFGYIRGWEARDENFIEMTKRIHELTNQIRELKSTNDNLEGKIEELCRQLPE